MARSNGTPETGKSRSLPHPEDEPTLTVERTAGIYGISRESAYKGVRDGSIPSIRVGRRILIPTAALRRVLEGVAS